MRTSVQPVFINASERSGTNLLRRRLTESQDKYFGSAPAHFLKNLYFREPYFGPLENDKNFASMLEAAIKLCTVHFAPWDIDWTVESLIADFGDRPRDTLFVMDFMMEKYAQENGCERYISKENFIYEFALDISTRLPGSKFIYLYRDPRDVIASQCKRQGNSKGVTRFARLWEYEQTRAIRVHEILAKQGLSVAMSYEQLIANEDAEIERLLHFLETVRTEKKSGGKERIDVVPHEWNNLSKATMRDNCGKYRHELSKRQIKLIEAICQKQMTHLGYQPDHYSPGESTHLARFIDRIVTFWDRIRIRLKARNNCAPIFRERSRFLRNLRVNYRSDR